MRYLFLAALAALPLLALHQAAPVPCLAELRLHQEGQLLHITGSCRSQLAQVAQYRYELRTQRVGSSGRAATTQSGRFELPAGQEVVLSQVSLSAGGDTHYHLHLLVYDAGGYTVAQDSASR